MSAIATLRITNATKVGKVFVTAKVDKKKNEKIKYKGNIYNTCLARVAW